MVPPPHSHPGRLVIIEGGDGTGKSTQHKMLSQRLSTEGQRVATFDFPNKAGTPIGKLIGHFLRGQFGQVTPEFLSLAFAVDRLVARESIAAELASGAIVLCDRYVASNIAFQSSKLADATRRTSLAELINWLEYEVYHLPRPDLEIALIASDKYYEEKTHLGRSNDSERDYARGTADIHEVSYELQRNVNSYFRMLPEDPKLKRIAVEDPNGRRRTEDEMAQFIWEATKSVI